MLYFLCKMAGVGIAHIVLGFFLYAGRIKHPSPLFYSDLFVFDVPNLLAFSGYFLVAWFNTLQTCVSVR
jgi:hypothetical protein